jgi:hypothetical protein
MSYTPLPPDLAYCVRIAAAWYDLSPSRYIRYCVQRELDDLADHNPILKEAFTHKR